MIGRWRFGVGAVPALAVALAVVLGAAMATGLARAQGAGPFHDADLALGDRLIAEHRCAACHQRKVGGDGNAIYRPKGRIGNAVQLRTMVEYCNTDLGLSLFPDEVNAIAAALNRDHYRFGR